MNAKTKTRSADLPELNRDETKVLIRQYNQSLGLCSKDDAGYVPTYAKETTEQLRLRIFEALRKTLAEDEDGSYVANAPSDLLVFASESGLIKLSSEEEEEEEKEEEESDEEEEEDEAGDEDEDEAGDEDEDEAGNEDEDEAGDEDEDEAGDEDEDEAGDEEGTEAIVLSRPDLNRMADVGRCIANVLIALADPEAAQIVIEAGRSAPEEDEPEKVSAKQAASSKSGGKFPYTKDELREMLKGKLKSDKARRKFIREHGISIKHDLDKTGGKALALAIVAAAKK